MLAWAHEEEIGIEDAPIHGDVVQNHKRQCQSERQLNDDDNTANNCTSLMDNRRGRSLANANVGWGGGHVFQCLDVTDQHTLFGSSNAKSSC